MNYSSLKETTKARLMEGTKNRILKAVNADPERFDNESHFVRVAIMKLLREVGK